MTSAKRLIALATLGLLLTSCSASVGKGSDDDTASSKSYDDNGVTFQYPSDWDELEAQSGSQTSGTNQLWTATVGPEESDLVNLSTYELSLEVNDDNIDQVKDEIDQVIRNLVEQAAATIESGPDRTTIAGFPAYKYAWSGVTVGDEEKSSEVYLVFNGKLEYFFNCQYSPDQQDDVLAGCHMILDSFEA